MKTKLLSLRLSLTARLLLATTAALLLSASITRADVIYTYTGNDFTSVSGSYTTTDSITGYIDLSTALGATSGPLTLTPVSFSFSDGLQTISNTNATAALFSDFYTNASGVPISWAIALVTSGGSNNIGSCVTNASVTCMPGDFDQGNFGMSTGTVNNDPGSWAVTETPLPAALPLFATSLGAMGLLGWRRKRKGVSAIAA